MPADKIKFRCPKCSKILSVASEHAGKIVACSVCKSQMRVPASQPAPGTPNPSSSPAAPARRPASQQPARQPVQREPAPPAPAPLTSAPATPFDFDAPPATGMSGQSPAANPFVSAPTQTMPESASASTTQKATTPRNGETKISAGKSATGLAIASLVAAVCTGVWLLVAAFTGMELGILAWGIGGLIGLVAGSIAKNGSPIYCGATAVIACLSVLSAKLIMALAIMAMGMGIEFVNNLADLTPEGLKHSHAMADQMLEDGSFEGDEKKYAEVYVASYFSGNSEVEWEDMPDEVFEASTDFDQRLKAELETKTPQQKDALVDASRKRHPEWIEDPNHYSAAVDQINNEEGVLSDELSAHAKSELNSLDGNYDEEYYETVAPRKRSERAKELRNLVAQRIAKMDLSTRDQMVRDTMGRHPTWNPYPDAATAMIEKMDHEGKFTGELAQYAKATIESEMTDEYPDYLEGLSGEQHVAKRNELQSFVSKELVPLDAGARQTLISETKSRHPDWYGQAGNIEQAQKELQEAMAEIGGGGTFLGALSAVFGLLDILWLFLGASTAYGTAKKYADT